MRQSGKFGCLARNVVYSSVNAITLKMSGIFLLREFAPGIKYKTSVDQFFSLNCPNKYKIYKMHGKLQPWLVEVIICQMPFVDTIYISFKGEVHTRDFVQCYFLATFLIASYHFQFECEVLYRILCLWCVHHTASVCRWSVSILNLSIHISRLFESCCLLA